MYELTDSRTRKSSIDWLTDSRNKEVDYWFVVEVFIFHHDELTDFQNKKINDWLSLSLTHDHFRKLTMRQMKMKFNHRFQRKDFFINANSRSFSLTHVVDDFLLIRVFLRMIRRFFFEHSRIFTSDEDFVSIRFFYEQLAIFFNYSRISTSIFGDFILLTRVFRRAICFEAERFDRMSVILAKFRARNRAVQETMNHRHCELIEKFRAEDVQSSRNLLKTIVFFSTRWSFQRVWILHRSSRWKSNIM